MSVSLGSTACPVYSWVVFLFFSQAPGERFAGVIARDLTAAGLTAGKEEQPGKACGNLKNEVENWMKLPRPLLCPRRTSRT